MFARLLLASWLSFQPQGADLPGVLRDLRAHYSSVAGAEWECERSYANGDAVRLHVLYRTPNKIRASVTWRSASTVQIREVTANDGHMVVAGPKIRPYTLPFNPDLLQVVLKAQLETVCFWDSDRQLSRARGGGFETSRLAILAPPEGSAETILEERPATSPSRILYYIDPKLHLIRRTQVFDLKSNKQLSDSRIVSLKPSVPSEDHFHMPSVEGTSGPIRYQTHVVQATNDGLRLAGRLYQPQVRRKCPLVVIAPGSGPADKEDVIYQTLADALASRGIGVVVYDKRGVGESEGSYEAMPDLRLAASDTLAFAHLVAGDPSFRRVGIVGLSQGGTLATIAAEDPIVRFIVALSGSGVSMADVLRKARKAELKSKGLSDRDVALVSEFERSWERYLATGEGYSEIQKTASEYEKRYARFALKWEVPLPAQTGAARYDYYRHIQFDPQPTIDALKIPLLALFGEKDEIIPLPETLEALKHAESVPPKKRITVKMYDGVGHNLAFPSDEPPGLIWFRWPKGFYDYLSRWILRYGSQRG